MRGPRAIVSAEVRPVLAGETSDIILANAKRVIRDAWVLSNAARAALPERGEVLSIGKGGVLREGKNIAILSLRAFCSKQSPRKPEEEIASSQKPLLAMTRRDVNNHQAGGD